MAGFKDFVLRGNVVDLAVGVIIGAAFGKVVGAVTDDFIKPIMPGGAAGDFSSLVIPIGTGIKIGAFINTVIEFLILAAVVYFVIVKPYAALMERLNPPPAPGAPPPPPADVVLLTEIRDLLKAR